MSSTLFRNGLLQNLEQVDRVRDSLNVMVPVDVLDTIDHREDNNPLLYTKSRIDATLSMLSENDKIGQACAVSTPKHAFACLFVGWLTNCPPACLPGSAVCSFVSDRWTTPRDGCLTLRDNQQIVA
jgi:hypothetical protein